MSQEPKWEKGGAAVVRRAGELSNGTRGLRVSDRGPWCLRWQHRLFAAKANAGVARRRLTETVSTARMPSRCRSRTATDEESTTR